MSRAVSGDVDVERNATTVHDAECPLADVDCESRTTDVTRLKQLGAKT